MEITNEKSILTKQIFWWVSASLLFIIVFATTPRLYYASVVFINFLQGHGIVLALNPVDDKTRFLREFIAPIKGLIFLFTLTGLLFPLITDISDSWKKMNVSSVKFRNTLVLFLILCALVLIKGLSGGNVEYADQSSVVFEKGNIIWSFQRFLMPAMAYILFFRGQIFFLIFSFLCVIGMIHLTQLWFAKEEISLKNWQLLSILTSGFLVSNLQYPGSPDVFIYSFVLLLFIFPLGELAELSLLTFALASHEASIILFSAIAIFFKDGKIRVKYFLVIFIYLFIWLVSIQFNLNSVFHSSQIRGFSPLLSIIADPKMELLGIFYTYRLLWILIIASLVLLTIKRDYRTILQITALIGSGVLMSLIGVDTLRMFSWSFFALLMSIKTLYEQNNPRLQKFLYVILALNLLIAPVYVDLHWIRPPASLYQFFYSVIGL